MRNAVTNPGKETRIKMSDIANPSPVFSIYDQWRDQWGKRKEMEDKEK